MRVWAAPIALLLLTGVLAGCVNTPKDTEGGTVDPTTNRAGSGDTGSGTGADGSLVRALPALAFGVTSTSPKWVEPGSTVSVSSTGQTGWTYVWSIGPLPGTVTPADVQLDTGSAKDGSDWIAPGASKSLTFSQSGVFLMHCHPHPNMLSNVTVVDGYDGPKEVHVQIVDGADLESYRFVPENIVVGKGTVVVYHNNGTQPHTATLMKAEPELKALPLNAPRGDVTVEGDGWQRIRVAAFDAFGRFGAQDLPVYVKEFPSLAMEPITVEFTAGGLPPEAVAPFTKSFTLEYNGTLNVSWSFVDAPAGAGAPVNNAEVDIHVFPQDSQQDVMTSELSPEGEQTTQAIAGTYTLKIVPKKSVGLKGTVTISAEYTEPVPPEPTMASAGGDDGHGGHAH